MKSPKVLIFTSSYLPTIGGLQYELKWFLDNLDTYLDGHNDIEVHFAYPDESSESYSQFNNIPTHDLRLSGHSRISAIKMILRFGRLLRRIKPDIVHCHRLLPDARWILIASRVYRVQTKIVVTSHGEDIVWLPQFSYGIRQHEKPRMRATQMTSRISAHIVPSQAMVQYAADTGSDQSIIHVIPNGIPVDNENDFEVDEASHSQISQDLEVDSNRSDGINILSLSSARNIKNLDTLVEAFSLARHELDNSKLLLACVGDESDRIVKLVRRKQLNDDVVFIGEVTGPVKHSYFRVSDVYCLVSHFESFSLSVLEAMKFESAVIASRVGGVPEFVKDGMNGLLVSPDDVTEIASSLVRLYKDASLRQKLTRNSLRTARRYSISNIIDHHISIYKKIADSDSSVH